MQTRCLIPITQNEAEGGIWEITGIAVCQLNIYFPLQTNSKVNIYMDEGGKTLVIYSSGRITLIDVSD